MRLRRLGSTGLKVSALALGGHLFPSQAQEYYDGFYGRRILEREEYGLRRKVVETALDEGINLLAADFDFEARALGRILKELGARNQVHLTAVLDFRPEPGRLVNWTDLEQSVDRVLSLLDTDHLDLPQIRTADWQMSSDLLADLTGELERLRVKGKIGPPAFYSSDHDLEVLLYGLEQGLFPVVMRAFGLLNPTAAQTLLPAVVQAGAGFIGFVPFQKGWLFDCGAEAGQNEFLTAHTGLSWALSQPGVTALMCGASDPLQIRQNAAAARALGQVDPAAVVALTRTKTYETFLERIKDQAPHLAHDWRVEQV